MTGYQLIAAVIAFIACYLAIGRIWQVDPLERRQLRQTFQWYGGLSGQQLGLKGPRLRQWLGAAGFLNPNAPMYYAAIVISMVLYYRFSKIATMLLIPYCLWVTFASCLNYAIWSLNRIG